MHRILEMMDLNVNPDEMNPGVLAYVGDVVYEIFVRTKITLEAPRKIKELNEEAKKYVKASNQAEAFKKIESFLSQDESEIYKRGRNYSGSISSKSATVVDYRMATGLEALVGYLYLKGKHDRLIEIMNKIINKE